MTSPRDLVGYGAKPPRVEWPHGARLALNIVLNYEEGSEANPLLGDDLRDERAEAVYSVPRTERELMQEAMFEYGSRVGHWRLMSLLDEYDMKATVFATGMALELNPEICQAFADHEYDFVGHGYRWLPHYGMSLEAERQDVLDCVAVIQRMAGRQVRGWFNRPPITVATRQIVAEAGLLYDSTTVDDDLPHYAQVAGRPLLILPYSLDTNDTRFWQGGFVTGQQFFEYLRDAFDYLYKESGTVPRMMSVGLHGRIQRPGRTAGVQRFLDHVQGFRDVWVARRDEIAEVWSEQFAPPNAWNWAPSSKLSKVRE
jgi:allantoinase